MKYMIASDIHGSAYYLRLLRERFLEEKADKLILLGDLLYHGARNPLPKGYSTLGCAFASSPRKPHHLFHPRAQDARPFTKGGYPLLRALPRPCL